MEINPAWPLVFPWKRYAVALSAALWLIHTLAQHHALNRTVISEEPIQERLTDAKPWTVHGYHITPLAHYHLRARLIHRRFYHSDRESQLSPVDFAVGWGPMSDPRIYPAFRITQRSRWYFWHGASLLSKPQVIQHSANMHLIPANPEVRSQLDSIRPGDIFSMGGYLVRVSADDGYRWVSSLSRTDTGAHSCELMWVEDVSLG